MKPTQNRQTAPRWAHRLLRWLHLANTREEVEGGLEELFAYWDERVGEPQASLRYVLNVVSVLPPLEEEPQVCPPVSQ